MRLNMLEEMDIFPTSSLVFSEELSRTLRASDTRAGKQSPLRYGEVFSFFPFYQKIPAKSSAHGPSPLCEEVVKDACVSQRMGHFCDRTSTCEEEPLNRFSIGKRCFPRLLIQRPMVRRLEGNRIG